MGKVPSSTFTELRINSTHCHYDEVAGVSVVVVKTRALDVETESLLSTLFPHQQEKVEKMLAIEALIASVE